MNKPVAYDIPTFCKEHNISRSFFYKLYKRGLAPRVIKIGRLTRIPLVEINEWHRKMEQQSKITGLPWLMKDDTNELSRK